MESRTRVWLNNQGLQDISPAIVIHDVMYTPQELQNSVINHARYHGGRLVRQRVNNTEVSVRFEVHEYDIIARQEITQRVIAWAMAGGVLTVGDRPGQQLRVRCTTPPAVDSAMGWTKDLTVVFNAVDNPFWEDIVPRGLALSGASASGKLYGAGSAADPFVEAEITPSARLSSIDITAGTTRINLTGMAVPAGTKLRIGYDDTHTLYIKAGEQSWLGARTPDSADDLLIPVGTFSNISYTASVSVDAVFSARGLYL